MISYNPQKAIFHLQGPTYSYLLGAKDGLLMHLYWGGALPCDAIDGLVEYRGEIP